MNGRVAKALRRLARKKTIGKPDRKYGAVKSAGVLHATNDIRRPIRNNNQYTVHLSPGCTRSVYKAEKKRYLAKAFVLACALFIGEGLTDDSGLWKICWYETAGGAHIPMVVGSAEVCPLEAC